MCNYKDFMPYNYNRVNHRAHRETCFELTSNVKNEIASMFRVKGVSLKHVYSKP